MDKYDAVKSMRKPKVKRFRSYVSFSHNAIADSASSLTA